MVKDTFFSIKRTLNCEGKIICLDTPLVMGILNVTSDSFYDGGMYTNEKKWLARTDQMVTDGASIVDIGVVSSRSGSKPISVKEELRKIIPVVKSINRKFPDTILSVDTYRSEVAKAVIESGAHIINDISGGQMDIKMLSVIAKYNVPYVLMHMQGTPATMQKNPQYKDVVKEMMLFFAQQVNKLHQLGVSDVIIDPGFGFGKTLEHNYEILSKLETFKMLECPILVGLSRKSMINKLLGVEANDALTGTIALNMLSLTKGANILRVHDVKEARQTVRLFSQLA